jgi:hypothetical protein
VSLRSRAVAFVMIETAASCSLGGRPTVRPGAETSPVDYCQMATVALRETVKSNDEQPYGIEDVCVHRLAAASGKIYVDARFMGSRDLETVPVRSCTREKYVIRFDYRNFERSPSEGVVLLMVSAETASGRTFNAVVEESDWPSKRPRAMALSPCGSAFGVLRRSQNVWTAIVVPPPRAPDAL